MNKTIIRVKQITKFLTYLYYLSYCKIRRISNDDVWLISERGIDARDNGYVFFKYLKKNHPEINAKYVISKDSADFEKILKIGDIVEYGSKEHYILFITAGMLISTHIMGFSPDMGLFSKLNIKKILKIKGKLISLKHGITKDYLPKINPKDNNLSLLISGALPEYNYFVNQLKFSKDLVKYTGFARFDNLVDLSKNNKAILVMPTFRTWQSYNSETEFIKSKWYKEYNSFLNDKLLLELLEDNDLILFFYPHIEFQKYLHLFENLNKRIVLASNKEYDVQDLLKKSKVLITDYSSVFFDFAYMKKPILYFQFDMDEYRQNHYKEGYFKYDKDGFGPVYKTKEMLIEYLKKIIDNNYAIEESFCKKIDIFFKYNDNKNCDRIYNELRKIERKNDRNGQE